MKKRLLVGLLFLITYSLGHPREVDATYYHPVPEQCSGNPLLTADGSKINLTKLRDGQIRWVAMSRDLLSSGFKLGDTIHVSCCNDFFHGVWVVKDKTASRIKNKIDFLLHPDKKEIPPEKVVIKKI